MSGVMSLPRASSFRAGLALDSRWTRAGLALGSSTLTGGGPVVVPMTARLSEGNVALVVTVAAAFASSIAFSSAPPGGGRLAALLLGGLAYLGFGLGQEAFVRRVGPAWRTWGAGAYFLGQT